jgi:hypothetical protein
MIIAAFWHQRKENLSEVTGKLVLFLETLQNSNSILFKQFFRKGKSKKESLKNSLALNAAEISGILSSDQLEYKKEGFTASVWTGQDKDEEAAQIRVSLGSFSDYLKNSCVLELPDEGYQSDFYKIEANQQELIEILKSVWQPETIKIDGRQVFP